MLADSLLGRMIAALARAPEAAPSSHRSQGLSLASAPGRVVAAIARTEPAEAPTSRALLVIVMTDQNQSRKVQRPVAAASPAFFRYGSVPPERLTMAAQIDITASPVPT